MTDFELPADVDLGEYGEPFAYLEALALYLIAPENEWGDGGIVQFQVWNSLMYRVVHVQVATNALARMPEVERCFKRQRNQRSFYRFTLRVFNRMCELGKVYGLYAEKITGRYDPPATNQAPTPPPEPKPPKSSDEYSGHMGWKDLDDDGSNRHGDNYFGNFGWLDNSDDDDDDLLAGAA